MKRFALISLVLLFVFGGKDEAGMSQEEVGDFNITRTVRNYRDFVFQVEFEQQGFSHGQYEMYHVVIAIKHDKRKHVNPAGYIEVWDDKQFIYCSKLPQTEESHLRMNLKKKLDTENAMLFYFQINPRYIKRSLFDYQVLRDDGRVEMNCVVRLKDFVEVAPSERLAPKTSEQAGDGNAP